MFAEQLRVAVQEAMWKRGVQQAELGRRSDLSDSAISRSAAALASLDDSGAASVITSSGSASPFAGTAVAGSELTGSLAAGMVKTWPQ